jgi:large subunit ribosomal protein L3
MLEGMIGRKLGMTRLFLEAGRSVPVTVIQAGPCQVVQVKDQVTDGYAAVQLGFGDKRAKRVTKPLGGHFAKASVEPKSVLKEFRVAETGDYQVGQEVTAELFAMGDKVHVTGRSKGRGYTGVVKRHGFAGGKDTHGVTTHDKPGSIGMSADPSRVHKGKKMPGQHGSQKKTVKNLKVVDVRPDQNLVIVAGAVPGANGSVVYLRKA